MNITLLTRRLPKDPTLETRLRRRLSFALGRFQERLGRVTARLEDLNGPGRGGLDTVCTIEVEVAGQRPVRVHHLDVGPLEAVDAAVDRLARVVARRMDRLRRRRRVTVRGLVDTA